MHMSTYMCAELSHIKQIKTLFFFWFLDSHLATNNSFIRTYSLSSYHVPGTQRGNGYTQHLYSASLTFQVFFKISGQLMMTYLPKAAICLHCYCAVIIIIDYNEQCRWTLLLNLICIVSGHSLLSSGGKAAAKVMNHLVLSFLGNQLRHNPHPLPPPSFLPTSPSP